MFFIKAPRIMLMAVAIGLGFISQPVLASTFNAGADFDPNNNPTQNPNDTWSYGWSSTLGSGFNLYTQQFNPGSPPVGTDIWSAGIPWLIAEHNGTGGVISDFHNRIFQPDRLALHPGQNGQYSILRWTAPETGTYSLTSAFSLLDRNGGSTDVNVLHNNDPLFSDFINGFGSSASSTSFDTMLSVLAGDMIDFAVGFGGNGFGNDTTGVDVTITSVSVPEPSSVLGILALGTFAVGSLLKRQTQ